MSASTTLRTSTGTTARSSSTRTRSTMRTTTSVPHLASFRSLSLLQKALFGVSFVFFYLELLDRIQPPSIRPISSIISCKQMYFLLSKDLVSFIRRMRKRRVFNLTLAFSRIGALLALLEYPASRKSSTISIMISSLRSKMVNRSDFKTTRL